MYNLEQVRARNVLKISESQNISGVNEGEVIKKIPPIIKNNGFLAAAAYAFEDKQKGWKEAFNAVTEHLSCPEIALVPKECKNIDDLVKYLTTKGDSEKLKLVTAETMAWFNYARRLIKKNRKQESPAKNGK